MGFLAHRAAASWPTGTSARPENLLLSVRCGWINVGGSGSGVVVTVAHGSHHPIVGSGVEGRAELGVGMVGGRDETFDREHFGFR